MESAHAERGNVRPSASLRAPHPRPARSLEPQPFRRSHTARRSPAPRSLALNSVIFSHRLLLNITQQARPLLSGCTSSTCWYLTQVFKYDIISRPVLIQMYWCWGGRVSLILITVGFGWVDAALSFLMDAGISMPPGHLTNFLLLPVSPQVPRQQDS